MPITITILNEKTYAVEGADYRHAEVSITDGANLYAWRVGGLPTNGDLQTLLDNRADELWSAASGVAETITDSEVQLAQAAAIALQQGKAYLRQQLIAEASPNADVIFNTLLAQVQSNEYLLRMVIRERELMSAAFGWGVLDTDTPLGRVRYIKVVEQVISLLT